MSNRVLPIPEKFASCPYDEKVLSFYEGQFDCVYVLLHPFIVPTTIDIEKFSPENWPNKHEIIEGCNPITWQEILKLSKLKSISDIDIGLRTNIGGLRKDLSNDEFSNQLSKLEKENIIYPQEGDLSPLLENRLLKAIQTLGYNWLWIGDEFGSERKLHWVDDLIDKNKIPSHGCIFTHDHDLLVATHWDSHCSFLCSSKENVEKIISLEKFEGFYCTENTEVYWGAYEI